VNNLAIAITISLRPGTKQRDLITLWYQAQKLVQSIKTYRCNNNISMS